MGEIGHQIGLGRLRRASPAQVAGDFRVEVQRDQVVQMALVQPFGDQSGRRQTVHRAASQAPAGPTPGYTPTKEPDLSTGQPQSSRVSDIERVSDGFGPMGKIRTFADGHNGRR
jgi:hypothetical protein